MTAPVITAAPATAPSPGRVDPKLARLSLLLLLSINLFNYIDRQVLAAVEPEIRKWLFAPNDPSAEFWSGLFYTAFLVSFMCLAPVFGWLADRGPRWLLVGIGVLLWTVASGASGVEWGLSITAAYWLLLLTRAFVGVGEAAYGPVAPTMISDLYPVAVRGKVLAWFYLALPVGGALGYALGEICAGGILDRALGTVGGPWELGWRWAFFLVVPPGIALGVWCFLMREPPKGQADSGEADSGPPPTREDYFDLARIPSYVLDTLGMTGMCFAMGGLAYWMPKYFDDNQIPGIGVLGPRTVFGILVASGGLIATLLGGIVGDWLRKYHGGSYFLVSGVSMCLGFPMVLLVLWLPFPLAWVPMFFAIFCLFFNTGPSNTILANVTHPAVRATGFAINIFVIHLLGDAISPPVIGLVKWALTEGAGWSNKAGLDAGFVVVALAMLVGGVFWIWGARYLERDTQLAPTRLRRLQQGGTRVLSNSQRD